MGRKSQKLNSIVSDEFLTNEELFETLDIKEDLFQIDEIEKIKKDLHGFCELILENFRDEKKNKHK